MSRAECATLAVGLALVFGALWGLAGGIACGVFGVFVGGMLGLVIGNS